MKVTWGTAIVLAIVSFVSFILFFVITMSIDKDFSHDLVTEEYYKKEVAYQEQLDKETNAQSLAKNISIQKSSDGVEIYFPENLDISGISGKIVLYRPSDKQLDFEIPVSLLDSQILIPHKHLAAGRWNIEIDWEYKEKSYLFKEHFTY